MSENKLKKFVEKPRKPPVGKKTYQALILADSKGKRLKKYGSYEAEKTSNGSTKEEHK